MTPNKRRRLAKEAFYAGLERLKQDELQAAEASFQKAANLWKTLKGVGDELNYARSLKNVANTQIELRKDKLAKSNLEHALGIFRKILGTSSPDVANTLSLLAEIEQRENNYETAKKYYNEALTIQKKLFGETSPKVVLILNNLAVIYIEEGAHKQGSELFEQARAISGKNFPAEHIIVKTIETNYLKLQEETKALKQQLAQQQIELEETKKLSYLGCMATGIAHNINNPTGIISAQAQRGLRRIKKGELAADEAKDIFNGIMSEVRRLADITKKFQDFAKGDRSKRENIDLNQLAKHIEAYFKGQFESHDVKLILELAENQPTAYANQFVVEEILINLVTNARESTEPRPDATVWIKTTAQQIQVEDNGPGVPKAEQNNLFLPFHSSKAEGTGLGLYLAKSALTTINGQIKYQDRPEGGACFTVTLPKDKNHE